MANKNNVTVNDKNTQIKNKKSDEIKKKKLRLHSRLKVNIPLFQSLMMILPSLAKQSKAEVVDQSSNDADLATTHSVTEKAVIKEPSKAETIGVTHQDRKTSDSHTSATLSTHQSSDSSHTHLTSSHHLSTFPHPQIHYIPSVSMPTISSVGQSQPAHSDTPPAQNVPVTFVPEVIKGTYGELHVDVNGRYTFVLNPKSPQYILLNQHQQGTDHFVLHLSNGSSIIVQIPVTGQQDTPSISGDLTGVVTEDHNIDSQGLLHANGKIDIVDPDQHESSITPQVLSGKYGSLTIDTDGHWQYQVDNSLSNVQALTSATSLHESFTIHTKDGTPQTIDMTIGGNDDNALITGVDAGSVIEELTTQVQGQLAVADPDLGEDHFQATQVNGQLGTLTITKDGSWTYVLDNVNPTVQALGKGSTATDTITLHSADGTPHQITVTINGTNDHPIVSGASNGAVIEQGLNAVGVPDATGSLITTDIDKSDTIAWAVNQPQGQWGTLSIDQNGHWHYQLDNSTGSAADKLAAGEHQTESFWVTATDSAGASVTHKIVIDVQGSNDKPIVSAWTQLPAGKEDQPVTIKASDLLTHASDVDATDTLHVSNLQATHGSLTDNNDGTYTFTPDKDFNGEIRLTYDVVDGHGGSISTQAKFDLTATPDNAIITDAQTNADLRGVTEDRGYIDTHYQLHYDGKLNIQDPDAGEAQFDPNIGPQTYQGIGYDTKLGGHILLMRDGHYTYTLDNRNIQNLAQGEVKHDSAVIRSADGTTHTIELTVHGTNDAPTINAQSHSVTEGGSVLNGQMVGHDIDTGATLTYSAPQIDGLVINPDGSYSFNPAHSSYQSLASGVTKTLTVPVTVTDEHNASSTQNLSITITGVNNSAVIGGVDTGDVTEGNAGQDMSPDYAQPGMAHLVRSTIKASGKLTISDTDTGEAEFDTHGLGYNYSGQYGDLLLRKDGTWFYHADTGQIRSTGGLASTRGTAIDQLGENQTLTDTITVYSKDSTSHDIVITIHGSNDRPYCASEVQLNSGKEDLAQTITATELLVNTVDVDANDAGKLTIANLHADHGSILDNKDGTYTFTPDKDYNGQVHFTYDVKDAHSGTTHTGANMVLTPTGDAAHFSGTDSGNLTEDKHVQGDAQHTIFTTGVLDVVDPDAGEDHFRATRNAHALHDPYGGTLTIGKAGDWSYSVPNGNVQHLGKGETHQVSYEVQSAGGDKHTITLTIHGTNDAPTVSADVQLNPGKEDATQVITQADLLANATDLDNNDQGQLSISQLTVDHGSVLDNGDGTYTLLPETDYSGLLHFHYQVNDAHGGSNPASASMTVDAVNDRPDVQPITERLKEDSSNHHAVDLLTGATDKEGDALSISHIGYSVDGSTQTGNVPDGFALGADGHSLVIDATHSAFQHLAAGQTQQVVVNYIVGDGHGGQTPQTATFTIEGTDDKALLTSNVIQMTESEALKSKTSVYQGNLQLTDPDTGDHTQFAFSGRYMGQGYAPGSLYIWPDGSYEFRMESATNRHADDLVDSLHKGESLEFPYQIRTSDGQRLNIIVKVIGEDDNARITVGQYSSLNNHANEDNIAPGGTHNQVWSGGNLHVIDPDHGQAGFVTQSVDTPEGGHFSINVRGGWQYTIDNAKLQHLGEGQSYQKTFTVESIDGTAQQTITVTVHGTNDTPVVTSAVSLSQGVEDTLVTLKTADLLAHASDVDDHSQLSVHNLSVDHGQVVDNLDGTFNFTPEKNYHGQIQFTYDIKDEHGASVPTSATMSLSAVNDTATFTGDSASLVEDTNLHHNTQLSGTSTIQDALFCRGSLVISDVDGQGEAALDLKGQQQISQDGTYGHFLIKPNGTWAYTADNNNTNIQDLDNGQTLTDSIDVTSIDGTKHSITVTISGSTDKPTIHSFTDSGVQNTGPIEGNLISGVGTSQGTAAAATDSDSNAHLILQDIQIKDPVSGNYVAITPGHPHAIAGIGTLAIEANGHYTFTPEVGFTGKVPNMVYRVGDDGGTPFNDFSQNTLSIEVKPPAQHAPTVTPQTVTSDEDQSHTFTAAEFGYQDADHDALNHITITQLPSHGLLTLNGLAVTANQQVSKAELDAGHLTFTPIQNQSGVNYAHFEFSANDGHKDSTSTSMVIDVNAVNDTPTVGSSFTSLLEDTPHSFTKADFKYTDIDGDSLHHITITNIAHGSLSLNGRAVSVGDDVAASDLASLVYTPAQDYHSVGASGLGGIQFTANDGHTDSKSGMYLINIVAVPDPATFSGDSTGQAQEDTHTQTSGTLSVTDPDGTQGFITVQGGVGIVGSKGYGHGHIDSNGHWTYNLYNNHANVQQLKQGQTDTETITVQAKDGTTHDIVITITGTNDAPTVSEHTIGTSHSVDEDTNPNARGLLDINDIDGDAVSVTVDPSHSAQFGSVQFDSQTNTWAYHLDNANPQVDALNDGDTLTDKFTLLVDDGHGGKVSKEIIMTINGHTDPVPYTPPTLSVTVDTRNAHHVTAGITANTVQAYAHSVGLSAQRVSGHHEIEGHGRSEVFIVQSSLHEEAELKSGNDILYIGGRLTDQEIEGGSGSDTLILGAYNRNNAPRLHSDKIGNMEIESIENVILGDGTVLKGHLPPNFPSVANDHYEVPVTIQAHLSSNDESVSSIRLTHLQQGLTLQSNGHNINANQDGSYTVPANGNLVVISAHPINNGHHYFETEVTTHNSVTGVTAVTTEDLHGHIQSHVNPPPPPPLPVQHDEPDFSPLDSVQDVTVTLDDSLSADAPLENHAQVSHEHPVGAAAYLDALGIQPNASPSTAHDHPADMDIVLAQVDQQHAADYDQAHLDMSDALEHHDAANNHNQDDEHHHHHDVDGLPDIDPNN
ncbi:hypothetical protein TW84_07870 [Vibrio neptunius]|uniref:VCBS domain-containing protein n=1 Tax=Vibrio neptunius TaxID=170651 RepID=UPI0005FA30C3|nr:VCBS domain-containing protein [Vibrio neptunius]KJY91730.1 hypothetical protein TW84_07870 [Vibrio neptunius]